MNTKEKFLHPSFTHELCTFYLAIQDYEQANQIANYLLTNNPTDRVALLTEGSICEVKGNQTAALKCYNEILEHFPNDCNALKRKALLELDMHMDIQALKDINSALNGCPRDSEAFFIRGMIHFYALQKKIDAIIDYNKAVELDSENAKALFHRGYAYLKYGNKEYARDDFVKSAKLGNEEANKMLHIYFPNVEFRDAT